MGVTAKAMALNSGLAVASTASIFTEVSTMLKGTESSSLVLSEISLFKSGCSTIMLSKMFVDGIGAFVLVVEVVDVVVVVVGLLVVVEVVLFVVVEVVVVVGFVVEVVVLVIDPIFQVLRRPDFKDGFKT